MKCSLTLCISFLLILSSINSNSHPSWGIIKAKNGSIYFVDVMHNGDGTLWEIKPDGRLIAKRTNIHAHQLSLSPEGDLFVAESIWRTGEIEGEGHNYLYKFGIDGSVDTLLFTDDWDLFFGGSFGVNSQGQIFFSINKHLWRYGKEGAAKHIDQEFHGLNTLFIDSKDRIWITERDENEGTLYVYNGGELQTVATHLIPLNPPHPAFEERRHQSFYGISEDEQGNIYVCENGWRKIYKVTPDFEVSEFYQSQFPWYPVGITFDDSYPVVMEVGYERKQLGPRVIKKNTEGGWKTIATAGDCSINRSMKGKKKKAIAIPDPADKRFIMIGIMLLFSFLAYQIIGRILAK